MYYEFGRSNQVLKLLLKYKNRQVVFNWYEDELLVHRDGYIFTNITENNGLLQFVAEDTVLFSIPLIDYECLDVRSDFQDFYQLTNQERSLEIYFPK